MIASWLHLALAIAGGVCGMAAIEQTSLYPPPKRGLQIVIAITLSVIVLQFAGLI